jgi:predicted AlkP superfamily pyrophosphatase or phosphodiesterase
MALTAQDRPKLVVGIVVDQMRQDLLYRYQEHYGEGGFNRFLRSGFEYRNAHFPYMHTATGPGHVAVHAGASPAVSGVIGNGWYERAEENVVNVVGGDTSYTTVGLPAGTAEPGASPRRMLVSTLADELQKVQGFQAKTVGVSIKDRGAILPVGHSATGAYWFDSGAGRFISSTYYGEELPDWVTAFNASGRIDSFNNATWELTLPATAYAGARADDAPYEHRLSGKTTPTFPYDLRAMSEDRSGYGLLPNTPFGNELVAELARAAVAGEGLGQGTTTDYLAVSFSSTDYAGHAFGPNSLEIADMYVRLDRTLAELFDYLDKTVGWGEYVVFLSADHGVLDIPEYLAEHGLPAVRRDPRTFLPAMEFLQDRFGLEKGLIYKTGMEFYLNYAEIEQRGLVIAEVAAALRDFVAGLPGVAYAYTADQLLAGSGNTDGPYQLLRNGFFPRRSGDVFYIDYPQQYESPGTTGTGHGSPYTYDTHVPVLWYGWQIPSGSSVRKVHVTDIAPTLSMLLRVPLPNGAFGEPLLELFD